MRVAIAEDSGFFRGALVSSLREAGIEVSASVDDASALVEAVNADPPDVVIVDICLPPTKTDEGLIAAEKLGETHPAMGVLVLSAYLAMPHVTRLLSSRTTGVGCLGKDQLHDTKTLVEALERVAGGGTYVDPSFVEQRFRPDTLRGLFTPREMDMLRSMAEGCSNQAMATKHHVSIKTVEATLTSIFRKMNLDSREVNARVSAVLTFLSNPQSFIRMQG